MPIRYTQSHISAVRYIVIPYKEKGDAVDRMPRFKYTRHVYRDIVAVFISFRWGSPS